MCLDIARVWVYWFDLRLPDVCLVRFGVVFIGSMDRGEGHGCVF
jgi:hypothetical protein